jgi:hypothetical protein
MFPGVEDRENPFEYSFPTDLRYIVFFFAAWKTGRKLCRELSSQYPSQAALGPLRFAKKYGGNLTISLREIQLQEYHFMPISRSNAAKYVECGSPYPQGASTDIAHYPRCRLCSLITLMM